MDVKSFAAGYETAYEELVRVMGSVKHQDVCGDCRACVFLKDMVDYVVGKISDHMTPDEQSTVFVIFVNAYERLRDEIRWG